MQHKLALSDNEIKDLRAAGYTVDLATDTPGAGYVWRFSTARHKAAVTPHGCPSLARPFPVPEP
jgi:hypothetical protein